jgi:hypothetical protein
MSLGIRKDNSVSEEKKYVLGEECPDCEEGEIYKGSSFPDDDGYDSCLTCDGKGVLPTPEELQKFRIKYMEICLECQTAIDELAQWKARAGKLEEALKFYAEPGEDFKNDFDEWPPFGKKPGKKARMVLSEKIPDDISSSIAIEKDKEYLLKIFDTYKCLLSCRKKMPGWKLEDAFSPEAVRDIEDEFQWFQEYLKRKKILFKTITR